MKTLSVLAFVLISLNVFAGGSWKRNNYHTVEKANNITEYRALRAKYPQIFIQEIDESRFKSAKVESFGWTYIGSTVCEANDPRLETITHKSNLCMDSGLPIPLCAGNIPHALPEVDPCL
jgi:hypothetical protein